VHEEEKNVSKIRKHKPRTELIPHRAGMRIHPHQPVINSLSGNIENGNIIKSLKGYSRTEKKTHDEDWQQRPGSMPSYQPSETVHHCPCHGPAPFRRRKAQRPIDAVFQALSQPNRKGIEKRCRSRSCHETAANQENEMGLGSGNERAGPEKKDWTKVQLQGLRWFGRGADDVYRRWENIAWGKAEMGPVIARTGWLLRTNTRGRGDDIGTGRHWRSGGIS